MKPTWYAIARNPRFSIKANSALQKAEALAAKIAKLEKQLLVRLIETRTKSMTVDQKEDFLHKMNAFVSPHQPCSSTVDNEFQYMLATLSSEVLVVETLFECEVEDLRLAEREAVHKPTSCKVESEMVLDARRELVNFLGSYLRSEKDS